MKKESRCLEDKCKAPFKFREVADIERDMEDFEMPFHRSVADHIKNPNNREHTVRLIKHLIVEQILIAPSIHAVAAVYSWLVKDWFYRPSFDLYKGFLAEMTVASSVCAQKQGLVVQRMEEFKRMVEPVLKGKVGIILLAESSPSLGRTKRKYESLPSIPEEAGEQMKRSQSQDELKHGNSGVQQ